MDPNLSINKALLLLDKNRDEDALILLKALYQQSRNHGDHTTALRTAAILGDYYYHASCPEEARYWLNEVNNLASGHPDIADTTAYEITRSRRLLSVLSLKKNKP